MTDVNETRDCDPSAADIAEQCQVSLFKDVAEFVHARKIGSSQAQAVILATPTHTHVPMAKQLIQSGVSILIEKPVAVTGKQGKDLVGLWRNQSSAVVMVGHHRRHNSYGKTIKKVIDSGKLGEIIAVNGGKLRKSLTCHKIALVTPNKCGLCVSQTNISLFPGGSRLDLAVWLVCLP